uniref:Uncharacterized protein n=1 Tax=Meloidogyne enterolobii TaxID=390850 RepID=A0A6V7XA45_MELEN|nr:unnamed protein product [Meloidogyne enterolobii]
MRKTGRDSDEDEEYLIRKNNEDKIENVGSSKDKKKGIGTEESKSGKQAETKNCLSKFFTTFEKFIINMPISNDLIHNFAEFLCLKYCDGNGMLKTYNINRQEEDEKLKDLLSYLKEKIGKDLTEIYNNNEKFQKDYSNERGVKWRFIKFFDLKEDYKIVIEKRHPLLINKNSEDEILSLLKQNYFELSNQHSTPLTEEKALISVDILVSIYSINQQMLTHFPKQIYRDWEYYSTLMLIFVDKIFEENKEISKEMTKEFTKIMNMLYLLRVLSDEEILLQDCTSDSKCYLEVEVDKRIRAHIQTTLEKGQKIQKDKLLIDELDQKNWLESRHNRVINQLGLNSEKLNNLLGNVNEIKENFIHYEIKADTMIIYEENLKNLLNEDEDKVNMELFTPVQNDSISWYIQNGVSIIFQVLKYKFISVNLNISFTNFV